jgi:DNA primase
VHRYVSEPGSHNQRLFNADFVNRRLRAVLVVEGVLDCISLRAYGIPACAAFQGNNLSKPWRDEWNRYLRNVDSVLIVPDNDASGVGARIAEGKLKAIPHSRILRLPSGYKDVGEYMAGNRENVKEKLLEWLGDRLKPFASESEPTARKDLAEGFFVTLTRENRNEYAKSIDRSLAGI